MTKLRAPILVLLWWASLVLARAQSPGEVKIDFRSAGDQVVIQGSNLVTASNDVVVIVTYTATNGTSSNAVLTADRFWCYTNTGDIYAEGSVHVQSSNEMLI